jgi:hypothetical protein
MKTRKPLKKASFKTLHKKIQIQPRHPKLFLSNKLIALLQLKTAEIVSENIYKRKETEAKTKCTIMLVKPTMQIKE